MKAALEAWRRLTASRGAARDVVVSAMTQNPVDDRADLAAQARREADALLEEYPHLHPMQHEAELERSQVAYDGGPELAAAVAAEMRRRAEAGVRFWPGPRAADD